MLRTTSPNALRWFITQSALLLALAGATAIPAGCDQPAAHDDEASDDYPELAFSHEEILERWTLDGDFYVSPVLEAPLGATRVGVLMSTHSLDEAMPDLETRDAAATGEWLPVLNTFSEEGVHVGTADIAGGTTSVQLRMAASLIDTVDSVVFSAVIPADPDIAGSEELGPDEETEVGLASEDLRSDLASIGVRSRSQWGARSTRCSLRDTRKTRMAIHHTVSPSGGNIAAMVRGFQRYHMDSNGWCDIGYHFLVGADGTMYEGRPLDLLGAHVGSNNTGNIGIAFIGCFDGVCPSSYGSRVPSDRAIRAAASLVGKLSRIYGISVSATTVKGHRQHSGQSTTCPGGNLLSRLDTIRSLARSGAGSTGGGGGGGMSTPGPTRGALGITWTRSSAGMYTVSTTSAPSAVTRVDYYVDGWRIASVRRSTSDRFSGRYRFTGEVPNRRFEARGYDSAGRIVARGYGLIEPVPGMAIAIRQTGRATYEFSVERAPGGTRAIEVSVDDGYVLRDSVSGLTRSTRLAVKYEFVGLRSRPFRIRLLDGAGNVIRTERRTFTLH